MNSIKGRILCVDPGRKRIGLAISDPSQTIARPLKVIEHVARRIDAAAIAQTAQEEQVVLIIVGQALDSDGQPGPMARRAGRLADAIREQASQPVLLWDESGSTESARSIRSVMAVKRSRRSGHLDDLAASVILQSFLDAHSRASSTDEIRDE